MIILIEIVLILITTHKMLYLNGKADLSFACVFLFSSLLFLYKW